jgi:hypothetical protein
MEQTGFGAARVNGVEHGLLNEGGFEVGGGGPADDFPAVEVHDGGQIKPALSGKDISDVADPNAIGRFGFWSCGQAIGRDGMRMIGVSGFGFKGTFLPGFELQLTHVAGDPITAARQTLAFEADRETRTAINFAVGDKERGEGFSELQVL